MHTLIQRPLVISRVGRLGLGQGTSDEALLGAIAAGDQRAMQVLYARHHMRVYRFVLRLTRDRSLAEDLVSEVFLDVWRRAGGFKGKSQVSTWMLAIARYKALSALRAHSNAQLDEHSAVSVIVRWPLLPVILTSGHPRERIRQLPPGVAYMPKPWQPLNVLIAAERALASGRGS
jgi:RNA polymerase sigma-70 factor (ECF subfamily)